MARLRYRSVSAGFVGDLFDAAYPPWLRAVKGKSGVYVIRSAVSKKTLYVGESHSGRLYETLTRHFQSWTGRTAGPTYGRGSVLVAVRVTAAGRAVETQNRLICELMPRDNTLSPLCELPENPF